MKRILLMTLLVAAAGACNKQETSSPAQPPAANTTSQSQVPLASMPKIDANAVLAHIKVLSSDEYEGRAPGTKGEELSVNYIADQFTKVGLKPGNTDGTFFQKLSL